MASGEPIAGAPAYALEALHFFAAAQLLCGADAKAEAILGSAEALKNSPSDRQLQRNMWKLVQEHSQSARIDKFVKNLPIRRLAR